MDPGRNSWFETDQILERNISAAMCIIGWPSARREFIQEALVSAHRDLFDAYQSNGNRDLSATGQLALTACIRFGQGEDKFKSRMQAWKKLQTHSGLLQIAASSGLKDCIAASIRQIRADAKVHLPQKVVAYALRGLIGAVYLGSERNLETTCNTIDALSRYLETDRSDGTNSALPTLPTLISLSNVENSLTSHKSVYHMTNPERELDKTPNDDSLMAEWINEDLMWEDASGDLMNFEPNIDHSDNVDAALPTAEIMQDFSTAELANPELLVSLHDLSLAHVSTQGKQDFVVTVSHIFAQKVDPVTKPKKRKGPLLGQKQLDEYVNGQEQLRKNMVSAGYAQWSPDIGKVSENPRHQLTLSKLYHGLVSALAIIRIKNALASRRAVAPLPTGSSETFNTAMEHYHIINRLSNAQAQNSIQSLYHIYKLYSSILSNFQSELADGFIHSNPQEHSLAVTREEAPGAGNPINRRLSLEYEKLLRCAESDWEFKTEEEQERLRKSLKKLFKLGERLHRFVMAFGLGILCFLLLKEGEQSPLIITETDFCTLPDTGKRELDSLIQLMTRSDHPVIRFAKAARPILDYIVDTSLLSPKRFRCELTEEVALTKMLEGSTDLLAQLSST